LKKDPNESMEQWADRVRKFELGYALQQIAKGQDVNLVMEAMAVRIQNKILHPIIVEIKKINENPPFD
jgi:glutamyl-tRNA reductase